MPSEYEIKKENPLGKHVSTAAKCMTVSTDTPGA